MTTIPFVQLVLELKTCLFVVGSIVNRFALQGAEGSRPLQDHRLRE